MRVETLYIFTGEEVVERLGATYIAECRKRSCWNTGRFKRIREKKLAGLDEEIIKTIYSKADYWYSHGLPKEYRCTIDVWDIWIEILDSCVAYDLGCDDCDWR